MIGRLLVHATRKTVETPVRHLDKLLGNTKCPSCRSADIRKNGRKYHCNHCGRDFS